MYQQREDLQRVFANVPFPGNGDAQTISTLDQASPTETEGISPPHSVFQDAVASRAVAMVGL